MSDAPIANPSSVRYSSYTPAQKRATQKYRINNKEKVNEQRKAYYESRKESDPQFLEYKRQKAKEYYQRKKSSTGVVPMPDDISPDVVSEPVIDIVPEVVSVDVPVVEPVVVASPDTPLEPPANVKVKKTRAPRKKVVIDVPSEVPVAIEPVNIDLTDEPPIEIKPKKPIGKKMFIPPVVVPSE